MFSIRQPVHVREGSCIAEHLGLSGEIQINSVHRQAIAQTAPRLQVEATAEDGTIEAVSVIDAKGFAIGVQWHPEYWAETDGPSRALFEAFGKAVRGIRRARRKTPRCSFIGHPFTGVSGTGVSTLRSANQPRILSATRSAMALRVGTEAEATCGKSDTLSKANSASGTFGSE